MLGYAYSEPSNPLVDACKRMQFLEHEYTKPILGNCSLCQRGSGTYRYVQGYNYCIYNIRNILINLSLYFEMIDKPVFCLKSLVIFCVRVLGYSK